MTGRDGAALLGFRLGPARAALPLESVREVMEAPRVVPVPGALAFVAGVALTGGVALPVYDLTRFEPLWAQPVPAEGAVAPRARHLILCVFEEVLLGLLGERVDLLEAPVTLDEPTGDGPFCGDYVSRLVRSGEEVVALLDSPRLFASLVVPADLSRSAREEAGEEDPAGR